MPMPAEGLFFSGRFAIGYPTLTGMTITFHAPPITTSLLRSRTRDTGSRLVGQGRIIASSEWAWFNACLPIALTL